MKDKNLGKKEFFMNKALLQAAVSLQRNEVPVGAIIVDSDGTIVARAHNSIERTGCQTGHAEVLAIQKACKKRGDWRLNGCWIYVTLEPCLMCIGLIQLARIKGVVYGAQSQLFGCGLNASSKLPSYAKDLIIEGGIKAEECVMILRSFFKQVRKK